MVIKEIRAKSILSASKVYPFVLNPYVGCQFGCLYCYARFMKKFTGHTEPWGTFVDVKATYRLTRSCLSLLLERRWPIRIQTKSPLVVRDIDLLGKKRGRKNTRLSRGIFHRDCR